VPGQGPAHGTLTLQPDGSFTYTPATNFVGADSFSYTVTDGKSPPVTVVQQIGVTNLNDPPVAAVAAYLSRQDVPLTGQLVASDIDGDTLTFSIADNGGPSHGNLQINPDGTFVYTPSFNYMGPESFTFSVSDGNGGTATATVAILINETNDAPDAQATQFALAEDTVLAGNIQARDVEGDQFTVSLADGQGPQHGVVTVEPDGRFVYTPDANYNGADSFVVRMLDQYGAASTQTITLAVAPVHDTPTAANLVVSTLEDTPLNMPWATFNPDGTSLQYRVVSAPALGTFTINGEAGFTYVSGPDVNGQDHIVYQVSNDGFQTWTSGTIDVGIAPVNDAPRPLIDTFFTVEDQWVRIVLEAYDIEGDAVANYAIVGNPAHGTLIDLGSGQYGYVPDTDWYGTDTFRYSITDEFGASAEYTATVGVSPVGNEPVVQSVEYTGLQDQYVYGTVPMYDPDTPLWQYYLLDPIVTQGQGGGLFELINTHTGEFVFRPTLHWSGTFQVELRAVDINGNVSEQPAYITFTLEAVNYAPSVVGDYALGTNGYAPMNTPLTGNLAALGSDVETAQADLVWSVAQQAAHGTVTIDANGDYVYTPNHGYTGWDSFQYQVTDANGVVSNAGTAAVHMNLVALPTVWGDQPEFDAVRSGMPISGQINATDENGPLQFYAIGDAVSSGRLTLNVDGTFTYNPPITFSGQDSFMIQTFDPIDGSSSEKIYSFGVAANNGPTALDEHIAVEGGASAAGQLDAFDPDGDALSFGMASGPAHGALQVAEDGSYVYVPANGFSGTDSFSYYVTDALGYSTTAIATIEIAPAPTVHDTSGAAPVTVTMGAGVDVVMASATSDTPDVVVGFDHTEDRIDVTALFGDVAPSDWAAHLTLENTAAGTYIGVDNAVSGAPEWSLLLANTTINSLDDLLLTANQNQV
jgi:VCBS repeat-containing protein